MTYNKDDYATSEAAFWLNLTATSHIMRLSAYPHIFEECIVLLQTRLPTGLAESLQNVIEDYKSDLSLTQNGATSESEDVESSQLNGPAVLTFPSGRLIETMTGAVQVVHIDFTSIIIHHFMVGYH